MGREVISTLAKRFPQLYVAPGEDAQELHRLAAGRGVVMPNATLDHFITSDFDELRVEQTPAGPIEVVFLYERKDFETFLQIVGHKAQPVPILPSVGAITYFGLADWKAVAQAKEDYLAAGGSNWKAEFARLEKEAGAFRTQLIVISSGPYSNIPASRTPYDSDEWIRVSKEIRLYHECAHVVCRRKMPKVVEPLWDEITADMVGLLYATDHYDEALAALFFGVGKDGYASGRLAEYVDDQDSSRMDKIAVDVYESIRWVASYIGNEHVSEPFELLLDLKRRGAPRPLDKPSA